MQPDLTGSPPPSALHLSLHSSWLHTLWTGHGEARNIKISSSNVHIFGSWTETAAPLLPSNHDFNSHEICIRLLWAQQTPDESGPADSEYSTISHSSTCLCYSVNTFPENFDTNALPGLLLLKPNGFPWIHTRSVQLNEVEVRALSGSLHHCLWIPESLLSSEIPAITRLFYFNGRFNKSSHLWIDPEQTPASFLDSNANFKSIILLSHGVTS